MTLKTLENTIPKLSISQISREGMPQDLPSTSRPSPLIKSTLRGRWSDTLFGLFSALLPIKHKEPSLWRDSTTSGQITSCFSLNWSSQRKENSSLAQVSYVNIY